MSNNVATVDEKKVAEAKTRLQEARKRAEEREAKAKEEAEAHELKVLELEEKCIQDYGKRGIDWEMIDTDAGVFVVTKPDFVVAKRFNAAAVKDEETVIQFVRPCVKSPDSSTMGRLFQEHGGLAWRCALACLALYEVGGANRRGKY
jgi:hypothetical protein